MKDVLKGVRYSGRSHSDDLGMRLSRCAGEDDTSSITMVTVLWIHKMTMASSSDRT
jgi:hypothetical protein